MAIETDDIEPGAVFKGHHGGIREVITRYGSVITYRILKPGSVNDIVGTVRKGRARGMQEWAEMEITESRRVA